MKKILIKLLLAFTFPIWVIPVLIWMLGDVSYDFFEGIIKKND